LRRASDDLAAGAGAGYRHLSGGRSLAPSGDWDSGNSAFAISRGSPGAPPLTPGHGRRFSAMLFSRAFFRTQVRHQIQRYLLSSLPAARAIQQCASWRTTGLLGVLGDVGEVVADLAGAVVLAGVFEEVLF